MRQGAWGDSMSLQVMSELLDRPIAVWRQQSMQEPIVVAPAAYDTNNLADLIYIDLDDVGEGNEHYSALSLSEEEEPLSQAIASPGASSSNGK